MEIDVHKKVHGPWHYDQAIDDYNGLVSTLKDNHSLWTRELKLLEKKLSSARGAAKGILERKREEIVREAAFQYDVLKGRQETRRKLREAMPFLVGGATLDSLLNSEPSSYDYIDLGQMPFDNLFFDAAEPLEIELPVNGKRGSLIGVHLATTKDTMDIKTLGHLQDKIIKREDVIREGDPYRLIIFMETPQRLEKIQTRFRTLQTVNRPEKHLFIEGSFHMYNEPLMTFYTDANRNKIIFNRVKTDEITAENWATGNVPDEDYGALSERSSKASLLVKVPRLAVNLVNYINSHNITVVSRNRKPRIIRHEGKFIEEPSSRKPFNLIIVKDEEVEETRETGKSWELNWRIYERGHPVRYRDEQGNIYLTTWQRPHIRGPPNAPWREQRYEVLAKKLEGEQAMYKQLGVE